MKTTEASQTVLTRIDNDGLATVTLNRAEKHNAFDDKMIAGLSKAFDQVRDSGARVMILAARGKSFCAGADLGWMQRMANYSYEENLRDANTLAALFKQLNTLPMATIARIQGAAYGGAVGLVSCCDMAIATPQASFCLSEVKIGLFPATISPYVIDAIGARAARRYFLSAEQFSAETAQQMGLISEIASEQQLDSSIQKLTARLLGNGPIAMQNAKKLILDVAGQVRGDTLIAETSQRIAAARVSEEGQQGLKAFLHKHPAPWLKQEN
jgi:methylglutaconyl-CoA hydratase